MLKTLKHIILLFFVIHTSIVQISLVRKEHILLNINNGSNTVKIDKDTSCKSVVQDIQEENNINLKVILKSSTDYFIFQVNKVLSSLFIKSKLVLIS